MPGMMKKYQEGGAVRSRRRGPSYEEDMTPPRGMRGFRSNAVPTNEPPPGRRGFEEDMTPPRGMRGFRSNAVPTDEPPPGRPQRYQAGGMVTHMGPGVGGAPPSPNVPSMGRRVVRPGPGAMPAPGMVRPPVANPGRPMPRPPVMQPGPGGGLMGGGGRPMPGVGTQNLPPPPGSGRPMPGVGTQNLPPPPGSGRGSIGPRPPGPLNSGLLGPQFATPYNTTTQEDMMGRQGMGSNPLAGGMAGLRAAMGRPAAFKKGGKIAAKAPVKKAAGGKVAAKTPAMKKGGVVKKAKGGMIGKGCK